jgi:hypothetical protein
LSSSKFKGRGRPQGSPIIFGQPFTPQDSGWNVPFLVKLLTGHKKKFNRSKKKKYERIQKGIFNRSVSNKNFLLNLTTSVS